jgi:hypothetical protein
MKQLTISRKIDYLGCGAAKWADVDHEKPLVIPSDSAKVSFYLHKDDYTHRGTIVLPRGHVEILFSPPPKSLIRGLQSKGQAAISAAELIYERFAEAYERFEGLLMSAAGVTRLLRTGTMGIHTFYEVGMSMWGEGPVNWSLDGSQPKAFRPKLPKLRGINPLYKADQLLTPQKWRRMQDAADDGDFPEGEVLELLGIRSKAKWRQKHVATIEAAIISEALLRRYAVMILKDNGFSNTKIKSLGDELSFNNMLNIVLPLSLTKGDLKRVRSSIQAVDLLRKIRNDLVHGNISEEQVEESLIDQGINGALRLAEFLKKKTGT